REVPLPSPRGLIRDRKGQVIAENVPGYRVSILAPREDSLTAVLARVATVIPLTEEQAAATMRRFKANPALATMILPSATFDIVSRLEEHRLLFPGLIIQDMPRRRYPDGAAVAAIVGYTGEVTE